MMTRRAVAWLSVFAAVVLAASQAVAAAEPWRVAEQPEVKQTFERAPVLQTESSGEPWESWLDRKLLSPEEAKGMMRAFVEQQIQPLPKTREEWLARRDTLRREILTVVGIDDLVPRKWDLPL